MICTNDENIVKHADRVLVIEEGGVKFLGTYEELRRDFKMENYIESNLSHGKEKIFSESKVSFFF